MVTFKLNGRKIEFPTRWEDVSYSLYIRLLDGINFPTVLAIITGIPLETIMTAEIKNIDALNQALSFMNTAPVFKPTKMLGNHKMPKRVQAETVGQFEDLQSLKLRIPNKPAEEFTIQDHRDVSDLYLEACAIFAIKDQFGTYNPDLIDAMKEQLAHLPCTEVIGIGSFFLFRPKSSRLPGETNSQSIIRRLKKTLLG